MQLKERKTDKYSYLRKTFDTTSLMLRIDNLGVQFGQTNLFSGINLRVGRGEVVCLTGPSGCGKTTLLRATMGFVTPYEGSVSVEDTLLTPRTADHIRRRIAWMPQGLSLPTEWVSEMVRLPFQLRVNRGVDFSEEQLLAHFDALGLEKELLAKRLHEISGGQRQRILLAITAMQNKPLLIIDEPTAGLDQVSTLKALQFVRQLAADEGRAVLAVSHDAHFMQGCSRVVTVNPDGVEAKR